MIVSEPPQVKCAQCADLLAAALEASQAYYRLLAMLEGAHIHNDVPGTFRLQSQVEALTKVRNNTIAALREHERTHATDAKRATSGSS